MIKNNELYYSYIILFEMIKMELFEIQSLNIFTKLNFLPDKINGSFMTSENRERYSWQFLVFPILWHELYSYLWLNN